MKQENRENYIKYLQILYMTPPMIAVKSVHQRVSIATMFQLHHFITLIDVSSYVIYAPNPRRALFMIIFCTQAPVSIPGSITRRRSTRIQRRQKAIAATKFISVLRYVGMYFLNVGRITNQIMIPSRIRRVMIPEMQERMYASIIWIVRKSYRNNPTVKSGQFT